MKFQSHVPNFIDADPAVPLQEFKGLDDLLANPWIKKWSEKKESWYKDNETDQFVKTKITEFRYMWTPNEGQWSKACLMAVYREDGKLTWWVLGYMDEIPALPKWPDSEYEKENC